MSASSRSMLFANSIIYMWKFVSISCGALVAQWVKHWATDLAVLGLSPAEGEIFSTINWVPLHTAFH